MPTKQQLRKIYLAKRQQLSPEEYAELNRQLLTEFQQLDFTGIKYLHCYLPILSKKEPDTRLLLNWLKVTRPDIKIVYPQTDFADHSMRHFADDADLVLAENMLGITEPIAGNMVDVSNIDMAVVPLLAFDKRGFRVGYGKGFYDRFMAQCKPGAHFIGLSFFGPEEKIEDIDGYDKPLHQCITPDQLYLF
ncbi:5-formyltetrahydrofolate cyclo-ligase [Mucilaginibacter sp. PPCGB 2223]|uniref:5-formyltetrahydrofolate cyclo-ligase n=1 Tax=Mucilaginibacter sp. PPCGB 2223 TaxID=1886027 RepID=UPI0008249EDC|nr:5-formyltetrahydrofolate cyclo-ligase [Mucilaginibacter sp. PPCGB 2223]OCX51156.1 5-formyltetrahydrofolate cyclo-ligase [Mucilaginibacter sp. PPCGB 2223]